MSPKINGIEVLSSLGARFLRSEEGRRLRAYRDQGGVWTIGDGHTGPDVYDGLVITAEQAEALFWEDVVKHGAPVIQALGDAPTTREQLDAMVILTYNIGVGGFITRSGIVAAHKRGDVDSVARLWKKWNTVKGSVNRGLVLRRAREIDLYLKPSNDYVIGGPQSRLPAPTPRPIYGEEEPNQSRRTDGDIGETTTPTPDADGGQKPLSQSRTISGSIGAIGGAVAGGAATVAEVTGNAAAIKENVGKWGIDWEIAFPLLIFFSIVVTVMGGGLAIWARIDDRKKGKN